MIPSHTPSPDTATLFRKLKAIVENEPGTIRANVAETALDYDTPEGFFRDLIDSGCASGLVSHLIYIWDTHAFFDRHYDEIEELREDWEENVGEPIRIKYDLKNFLAWFAFEETAYRIANDDLGLGI